MTEALAALTLAAAAAHGAGPAVLECSQRVEGGGPVRVEQSFDLVVGPIAFTGMRARDGEPLERGSRRGGYWVVKAAPKVRAGGTVELRVPPFERPHVRIGWAGGDAYVLRLRPCAPSTPAFSYDGVVGRYTAWAGGFLVDRPRCARIEVRRGGRLVRGRVPLGRPCP